MKILKLMVILISVFCVSFSYAKSEVLTQVSLIAYHEGIPEFKRMPSSDSKNLIKYVQYGVGTVSGVATLICAIGIGSGYLTVPAAICTVVVGMDTAGRFIAGADTGVTGIDNFLKSISKKIKPSSNLNTKKFIDKWSSKDLTKDDIQTLCQEITPDISADILNLLQTK